MIGAVQCSAVQCNDWCSAVQCSAVHSAVNRAAIEYLRWQYWDITMIGIRLLENSFPFSYSSVTIFTTSYIYVNPLT